MLVALIILVFLIIIRIIYRFSIIIRIIQLDYQSFIPGDVPSRNQSFLILKEPAGLRIGCPFKVPGS